MAKKVESAETIVAKIVGIFAVLFNTFAEKWTFAWIQESAISYKDVAYDCDKGDQLLALVKLIGRDVLLTVYRRQVNKHSVFTKKQLFELAAISRGAFDATDFTTDAETAAMLISLAKWADKEFAFTKASDTMPVKSTTPKNNGSGKATQAITRAK